jgi:predicted aldo/keto reductase-like oxidoreductase
MRYKQYGATGKSVSAVGFGGMRFDQELPNEQNAELLHYARAAGINYFDTAPGYGKSEDIFGIAFADLPKGYFVSTKAMPTAFPTAQAARGALMKSLERMKVPKVDFFHVWCLRKMEHYELAMKPGGMYDGLARCRDEGLIDHIVFSSHQSGGEIRQVLASGKFAGVLMGTNLLNFPYRWDGVLAAAEGNYGVVAMNPLAGGAIPKHEKQLGFLAMDGLSPTESALRFAIATPQITVALVGFNNRREIDQACRIADQCSPLTAGELEGIRKHLSAGMNSLCTGCGYCEGCPQNIPVASYMQYYNEKLAFGKSDADMKKDIPGQHEWGILVGRKAEAAACIECRQCEEACTQHLPIVERLREVAQWEKK